MRGTSAPPALGNATAANVLTGQTFSSLVAGSGQSGTMPENGAVTITPGTTDKPIPAGHHNGSGKVPGDPNFVAGNIANGVTVWGVTGTNAQNPAPAGTAAAAQVLTGYTFSNASASNVAGTMPENGSLGTITPGTAAHPIPAGHTTGGTVAGDANLVAGNIKSGVSIFGVAGNVSPRQFASGSLTNTANAKNFTNQNSQALSYYYVTVSGLTFQPSTIVVWTDSTYTTEESCVYQNVSNFNTAGNCPIRYTQLSSTSSNQDLQLDGTSAYVNSTGFQMPVKQSSITYHWLAFG